MTSSTGLTNKREPRVSIGLPVYNGELFIKAALDSILAQTFEDFELIVGDNASTDRTEEIVCEYAAKDRRIRYYRNPQNLGAARNYNLVLELSVGEYFKWAAHDDTCAPEYIERCVEMLDRDSTCVLCYANTTFIDERGRFICNYREDLNLQSSKLVRRYRQYHRRFLAKSKCNPIFGVIRKSILEMTSSIGNYQSSDRVLLAELALRGKFCEIPEYLFFRRDHPQMSTRANSSRQAIAIWFDPTNQGKIQMPAIRLLIEHGRAIERVPMQWWERTLCYLQLLAFARRSLLKIAKDAIKGCLQLLGLEAFIYGSTIAQKFQQSR